jgi:biotin carboxyl carrier protein
VRLEGRTVLLRPVDVFARREGEARTGSCRAPMPGRVVALQVAPGATVRAGDVLLVLEAMKMEHALEAPQDGVIGEVLCEVGGVVAGDQELIRFAP